MVCRPEKKVPFREFAQVAVVVRAQTSPGQRRRRFKLLALRNITVTWRHLYTYNMLLCVPRRRVGSMRLPTMASITKMLQHTHLPLPGMHR